MWCYGTLVLQRTIVYMFRELINYCITNADSSGTYSLSMLHSDPVTYLFISFWSGNVHQMCVGNGPRGLSKTRKTLTFSGCVSGQFIRNPSAMNQSEWDRGLSACMMSTLPGECLPGSVSDFDPNEFERCSSLPTAKIIELHDIRTIRLSAEEAPYSSGYRLATVHSVSLLGIALFHIYCIVPFTHFIIAFLFPVSHLFAILFEWSFQHSWLPFSHLGPSQRAFVSKCSTSCLSVPHERRMYLISLLGCFDSHQFHYALLI